MKKSALYITITTVVSTLVLLWGCCKDEPALNPANEGLRADLQTKVNYGVYVDGEQVFGFDNLDHQLYSRNGTVCRIQTDDGENYIEFGLSSAPRTGRFIDATMVVSGEMGMLSPQSTNAEFYILKISDSDCWIWSDKLKLGAVVWLR